MSDQQKFNYGGQAVIDGVMMRGSSHLAVAVRSPEGEIVFKEEEINSPLYNGFWAKVPFVRGLGLLWDALGLGTRALTWSADVAMGEEGDFKGPVSWITIAISLSLGIGLFFLLPAAAASGISTLAGLTTPAAEGAGEETEAGQSVESTSPELIETPIGTFSTRQANLIENLLEGIIRLAIVITYIWLIGRMDDVQTIWQYHGAEHKTINAYEAGAELTPEEVAKFPLEHPRCGTGFLLVVIAISIVVFSFVGRPSLIVRLASRVILLPVVAGIAYEYIRFLSRNLSNPIARTLVKPQLALQRLTTSEPTRDIIEVAIFALNKVLVAEQLKAAPEPTIAPEPVSAAESG